VTVLERILDRKRQEVEKAKRDTPESILREAVKAASPPRGFRSALASAPGIALIAEVKHASPSEGVIRQNFDPVQIAKAYAAAGATALSVLTDGPDFGGAPEHLVAVRNAVRLPILRKDFICDPYQLLESRALGADAILLIVAALDQPHLADLHNQAQAFGMDALVEVHDESELDRALAIQAKIIGVNNRNLATLKTTLETSRSLLPRIANRALAVSESALNTNQDVRFVHNLGAKAVLIGTAFCRAPDIEAKVREVMQT